MPENTGKHFLREDTEKEENCWKPFKKQEFALRQKVFEILFGGARGPGKTDCGIVWMLKPVGRHGGLYRGLVIRKNAKDLSDWIDRAKILYRNYDAEFVGQPTTIRFKTGDLIRTGHLKDKDAYNQYLGHEYQRMLLEELTQIKNEADYLKLISSCRSTVRGLDARVFCTTNPGGAGHKWVKDRFYKVADPMTIYTDTETKRTRMYIPATIDDNPILMERDPNYVGFLDGLDGDLKRAWRHGDWDISAGLFFDEFRAQTHTYDPNNIELLRSWLRYVSIDWGFTSPTAVYWHAVGPDSHVYTYREMYVTKMLDVDLAKEVKRLSGDERIVYAVGDPASFPVEIPHYKFGQLQSVRRADVWAENGVPIVMGKNDRVAGWSRMREFLRVRPYLQGESSWWHISSDCKHLIDEMTSVVHDEKNPEDLDTTMNDHALDSCRLFLMSLPKRFNDTKRRETMLQAAERQSNRIEEYDGEVF